MINELENNLKDTLGWHKSRIRCLVQIIMGLIAVRSVNLKELACAFMGATELNSHYRRLQRFFAQVRFPRHTLANLLLGLFYSADEKVYLSMDRTNWQWGKANINLLVLSACYRGVAIPLYWRALDKRGNSNTQERIALIKEFIDGFGKARIAGLLGDREFVGDNWLAYLLDQQIAFDLRVKKLCQQQLTGFRSRYRGIILSSTAE